MAQLSTSAAALRSILPHLGDLNHEILRHIQSSPSGLTCDEVEQDLNLRHQTASARIRELAQHGLLVDSQERRRTRAGRSAAIWRAAVPRGSSQSDLFPGGLP
jgi:predicted ArsR family transcriptional regulator